MLLTITTTLAQPAISWQKSLGGSANDNSYSIQQTLDGGYITAGETSSPDGDITTPLGGYDIWIVKMDASGTMEWQKSLGGSGHDAATCIRQTMDGGYIVAGSTNSTDGHVSGNHGLNDYWIVKLSATGQIEWQKSLGGTRGDWAYDIQQTLDSGYIIAGMSESNDGDVTGHHGIAGDYWIVKLDNSGNLQWQKSLGGDANDSALAIRSTPDDGYIVTGRTRSNDGDVSGNHGDEDIWVVKLNNGGDIEWAKCLGGSNFDAATSVLPTDDGGYLTAGITYSSDGDVTNPRGFADYWLVKLDATGSIQWQKCYGGLSFDFAQALLNVGGGNFVLAGYSYSDDGNLIENKGNADYWIVKINDQGDILWQKSFGGSGTDFGNSIEQTADAGLIVAGQSNSTDYDVTGNHGQYDFWVVKLEPDVLNVNSYTGHTAALYPNPVSDRLYIGSAQKFSQYELYDATGKQVALGSAAEFLSVSSLASGWYVLVLSDGDSVVRQKFLKK